MKPLSEREAIIGLRNAQLEAGHALNTRKSYRGWMLRYRALGRKRFGTLPFCAFPIARCARG